jgi:hypothetical protein
MDHRFEAVTALQLREANADGRSVDRIRNIGLDVTEASFGQYQGSIDERTDELVAAVTCEHVVRAQALSQRQADLAQQAVAVRVTALVIDPLQMVDVEKRNDQWFRDPVRPIDRLTQLIAARNARQHTGDVIAIGVLEPGCSCAAVSPRLEPVEGGGGAVARREGTISRGLRRIAAHRGAHVPRFGFLVTSRREPVSFPSGAIRIFGCFPTRDPRVTGFPRRGLIIHRGTAPAEGRRTHTTGDSNCESRGGNQDSSWMYSPGRANHP